MNAILDLKVYIGNKYKFQFILAWLLNLLASIIEVVFVGSLALYISSIINYDKFISSIPDFLNFFVLNYEKREIILFFQYLFFY